MPPRVSSGVEDAKPTGHEVRSVQRALQLVRVMNERKIWTLRDLTSRTALAKSTVHRLLATLEAERFVEARQFGYYQLSAEAIHLSMGVTDQSRLVEAAKPLLQEAMRTTHWPLTLAVINQARSMHVVACSLPYTPYAILSAGLGRNYDLVHSAVGRAYLAFCTPSERRVLVESLQRQEDIPAWRDMKALGTMVRQTRAQGYALRRAVSPSETTAFAVPVFSQRELRGSLAISTYADQYDEAMLDRLMPLLQKTADAIGEAAGGWF